MHPVRPFFASLPRCLAALTAALLGGTGPLAAQTTYTAYHFNTYAGTAAEGSLNGTGAAARFSAPDGVAVDGSGNIYIADSQNDTIRKIAPGGAVTTLAGTAGAPGSADGMGAAARFNAPNGVAVDGSGNVYVADSGNDAIREITAAGLVTTLAGAAGSQGGADGTGAAAQFFFPEGIAVDGAGNLYVTDSGNNTVRKITPTPNGGATAWVATTLAGTAGTPGSANGTGAAARFNQPVGVAVDGNGNVYVADKSNSIIRKITPAASGGATVWMVTTLAGTANRLGTANGSGTAAQFGGPCGVAVDAAGNIYVADTGNDTIRKITPGGAVTTLAGAAGIQGGADGTAAVAQFREPVGVAVDGGGNVYVADTGNDTIREITPAASGGATVWMVTTLAGASSFGSQDGTGGTARFNAPFGLAVDGSGNLYVADSDNDTIRKITPGGAVTTLAGTAGTVGSADGTGTAAQFDFPHGVAVDGNGNLYVADTDNDTIRKITPGGAVTTLAGTAGSQGSVNATGSAARFYLPAGVAVDAAGNIYVADSGNNTIREITPAGVVATLAGTASPAGGSQDGTGAAAQFDTPTGVAVDGGGNVYVADYGNYTIRKITSGGAVTTLAGTPGGFGSADGSGSAARFRPYGVAVDGGGNVYVADYGNYTIRKITSGGVVTTLAGSAGVQGSATGTGAAALFNLPNGVAVDGGGNVYVADTGNNTIRQGAPNQAPIASDGSASTEANQAVTFALAATDADGDPLTYTLVGFTSGTATLSGTEVTFTPTAAGSGTVTFTASDGYATSNVGTIAISIAAAPAAVTLDNLSQSYDGTPKSAVAATNPAGLATVITYNSSGTAPSAVGTYAVVATVTDPRYTGSASGTLTITASNQTVTFPAIPDHTFGDAPFAVSATASSGLPVTFSVLSGPATVSGDLVTLTGAGTVVLQATQAGGDNFSAANATESFAVAAGAAAAPTITTQPGNQTVVTGAGSPANAVFIVAASGSGPLVYQWQRQAAGTNVWADLTDGGSYSGSSTASLTVSNATVAMDGDRFACAVTAAGGSALSDAATLTVMGSGSGSAPIFTTQPQPLTVNSGSTAVFLAAASGGASYQWLKDGADLADSPTGTASDAILGSAGSQLMITHATEASAGQYAVRAANSSGSAASNAVALQVITSANPGSVISISTRAFVGTGDNILIGGFYIVGSTSRTVLIQALGPALASLGVNNTLRHPELSIHQSQDGHDVMLYSNTGWGSSQVLLDAANSVFASPALTPGSDDSELLLSLPPGGYSAEISGADGGAGVALCAIYELP